MAKVITNTGKHEEIATLDIITTMINQMMRDTFTVSMAVKLCKLTIPRKDHSDVIVYWQPVIGLGGQWRTKQMIVRTDEGHDLFKSKKGWWHYQEVAAIPI